MKRRRRTRRFLVERLLVERLEDRLLLASLPYGALPTDTAEYMLGNVVVSIVMMESNGTIDPNTENWTQALKDAAVQKVENGVNWWLQTLANATPANAPVPPPLHFQFDTTYVDNPVPTGYEPISDTSNAFQNWIQDFFNVAIPGQITGNFNTDIKTFNNEQRIKDGADWAYTIFVVNDANDPDHKFDPSGTFSQAFAYPGGEFFVSPASRPEKTFAHETGHMFWAMDEYQGGDPYGITRGYYNTPNDNAVTASSLGPPGGFVQQPSIMTDDPLWQTAFDTHTSSAYTLAMIGWQDTNGDGIFDVLDVPHTLTGSGFVDPASGNYRFIGESHVNTLINQNPSGNQSDITINRIRQVQYRFDGGAWQTIDLSDPQASANLDLTIPPPPGGFQTIDLRTYDNQTGVASPIFTGYPDRPSSTATPGISGFVYNDANGNGQLDPGETGLPGWTVELTNGQGPITLGGRVEPDDYNQGDVLSTAVPGVLLTTVAPNGSGATPFFVYAGSGNPASTGTKVFRYAIANTSPVQLSDSFSDTINLRIDFTNGPTSMVQLDAIGNGGGDYGQLEIYNSSNQLIGRYTTQELQQGDVETMTLSRPENDIAYAIAKAHGGTGVALDNLRFGPPSVVTTDQYGAYTLPDLPGGSYVVQAIPPAGSTLTTAAQQAEIYTGPAVVSDVNFGGTATPYQNPNNADDVTGDGVVDVNDLLALIKDIRTNGVHAAGTPPGATSPPYLDVNGDGTIDVNDILAVITYLRNGGAGEPPPTGSSTQGDLAGALTGTSSEAEPPLTGSLTQADLADILSLVTGRSGSGDTGLSGAGASSGALDAGIGFASVAATATGQLTASAGLNTPGNVFAAIVSTTLHVQATQRTSVSLAQPVLPGILPGVQDFAPSAEAGSRREPPSRVSAKSSSLGTVHGGLLPPVVGNPLESLVPPDSLARVEPLDGQAVDRVLKQTGQQDTPSPQQQRGSPAADAQRLAENRYPRYREDDEGAHWLPEDALDEVFRQLEQAHRRQEADELPQESAPPSPPEAAPQADSADDPSADQLD